MKNYKIAKGFIVQKIDNKINIFDGKKSVLYSFNKTGSYIFSRLKQKLPEGEIILSLVKKYSISIDKARQDFEEFKKQLKVKKIII